MHGDLVMQMAALLSVTGACAGVVAGFFGRWGGIGLVPRFVGFGSVLFGIGGGAFGVPLMTVMGVPIRRAIATAAGFGVLIAVPSVVAFLFVPTDPDLRPPMTVGAVHTVAFGITIAMALMTTPLGVRLALALNPVPLRKAFGVLLTLIALNMLRKVMGN